MRTRLFLSAAVATLSLCLSQGYAQNVRHAQMGGEAAMQGESTNAQKPGDERNAAQSKEHRAADQKSEHKAGEAGKAAKTGAAHKGEEKRGESAREESRQGAAAKHEEKQGAAAKREDKQDAAAKAEERRRAAAKKEQKKEERRGALDENKDRTPTAQEGRETSRPGDAGRMGKSATDEQRERRGESERQSGATGRDTYGYGGREAESGREAQEGREMRGGREMQGGREAQSEREAQGRREAQDRLEGRGGRVHLSQRDQTRVRQIISQQNVQRISPNIFSPRIGAVLPPSVQFYPLPPAVISMCPQFEGYNFVMVGDDIAIIDPSDREVVTVLDETGGGGSYGYGYGDEEREGFRGGYQGREEGREGRYGSAQREERFRGGRERRGEAYGYAPRVRLDTRQERALYRGVMSEAKSNLRQVCVRVGDRVPQSVDLEPVPRSISAEAPDVQRYEYFVLNDQVVLVDPDTRIVVDMIEEPR